MRYIHYLLVILILFPEYFIGQEKENPNAVQPMYLLKISSFTTNINAGFAKSNFNRTNGINWKHPFGIDFTTGVGYNYLYKNSIGIEASLAYELNYYMYKHDNVNLFLGYRAPYLVVNIKKNFTPKEDNTLYMKLGGGYMFGGSGGIGKSGSNYSYTINFTSTSSPLLLVELGRQKRINKKSFMDVGIVFKYGFNNLIRTSMNYIVSDSPLNVENAFSFAKGNYIGITFRYYHALKIVSPKVTSRKEPKERF